MLSYDMRVYPRTFRGGSIFVVIFKHFHDYLFCVAFWEKKVKTSSGDLPFFLVPPSWLKGEMLCLSLVLFWSCF